MTTIRAKSYKGSKKAKPETIEHNTKTIAQRNEIKELAKEINKRVQFFRLLKG